MTTEGGTPCGGSGRDPELTAWQEQVRVMMEGGEYRRMVVQMPRLSGRGHLVESLAERFERFSNTEWLPNCGSPWPPIDRSPTWPFGPFTHWLGPDDGHPWFTITEEPLEHIEFGMLPEVTEAERFLLRCAAPTE